MSHPPRGSRGFWGIGGFLLEVVWCDLLLSACCSLLGLIDLRFQLWEKLNHQKYGVRHSISSKQTLSLQLISEKVHKLNWRTFGRSGFSFLANFFSLTVFFLNTQLVKKWICQTFNKSTNQSISGGLQLQETTQNVCEWLELLVFGLVSSFSQLGSRLCAAFVQQRHDRWFCCLACFSSAPAPGMFSAGAPSQVKINEQSNTSVLLRRICAWFLKFPMIILSMPFKKRKIETKQNKKPNTSASKCWLSVERGCLEIKSSSQKRRRCQIFMACWAPAVPDCVSNVRLRLQQQRFLLSKVFFSSEQLSETVMSGGSSGKTTEDERTRRCRSSRS